MDKTIQERAAEWLKSGKTGASSKTIHHFFTSGVPSDPHYPLDSADFGRCVGLLEAVPEWQKRLPEMSAIPGLEGQVWAALAEVWLALQNYYFAEDLYTLNQRLNEIIEPLEEASGEVVKIGKNMTMRVKKDAGPISQALLMKAKGASDEEVYAAVQKSISEKSSDEELLQAARFIVASKKPSTSALQRHLGIGYNRAAAIMELLEKEGSVSAPDSGGVRKITEKLARAYGITQRIDEIAKATGTTPNQVFEAAKAQIGHNSGHEPPAQDVGGVSGQRLKAFLDRVERLEEEKAGIAEDVKDIFAEAKAVGFDTKIMRKVLRLRKMDKEKRVEEEELLELYKSAIGMD